jgi:hypothetical protein
MDALDLILYVLAAVFFLFAGVLGWGTAGGSTPRYAGWNSLMAFGLLCWVLVSLIAKARSM